MIEPILYFYDNINRNAITVKLRKPMVDWINKLYPDSPVTENEEGNIYLIHEKDYNAAIESWLKRNFNKIFENELNDWHMEEKNWPKKRTYKMFCEWFQYEIYPMVLDMEETPIIKN